MRPPHIRIRTLMILVAVVGLAIGGGIEAMRESRLAASYRYQSLDHGLMEDSAAFARDLEQKSLGEMDRITDQLKSAYQEQHERWMASIRGRGAIEVDSDELYIRSMQDLDQRCIDRKQELTARSQRSESLRQYHRSLRIKYDRAARYPWLPVAPDPPEPR